MKLVFNHKGQPYTLHLSGTADTLTPDSISIEVAKKIKGLFNFAHQGKIIWSKTDKSNADKTLSSLQIKDGDEIDANVTIELIKQDDKSSARVVRSSDNLRETHIVPQETGERVMRSPRQIIYWNSYEINRYDILNHTTKQIKMEYTKKCVELRDGNCLVVCKNNLHIMNSEPKIIATLKGHYGDTYWQISENYLVGKVGHSGIFFIIHYTSTSLRAMQVNLGDMGQYDVIIDYVENHLIVQSIGALRKSQQLKFYQLDLQHHQFKLNFTLPISPKIFPDFVWQWRNGNIAVIQRQPSIILLYKPNEKGEYVLSTSKQSYDIVKIHAAPVLDNLIIKARSPGKRKLELIALNADTLESDRTLEIPAHHHSYDVSPNGEIIYQESLDHLTIDYTFVKDYWDKLKTTIQVALPKEVPEIVEIMTSYAAKKVNYQPQKNEHKTADNTLDSTAMIISEDSSSSSSSSSQPIRQAQHSTTNSGPSISELLDRHSFIPDTHIEWQSPGTKRKRQETEPQVDEEMLNQPAKTSKN